MMPSVSRPALHPPDKTVLARYRQAFAFSLLLFAATIFLYFPVLHHPFVNIDDQGYVYENLQVQAGLTGSTVAWAFTTFDDNNWHPLTWLSHAADCQMFGIDPAGHHVMNMLWHAVDVVVLFWVLLFATGYAGRSFMVAALFALHPINVESVAWMAERKTLLSTLFFLLALGAYRWFARRPSNPRYLLVAGLFLLALMGKPQIITLPFVLLLWDYWPLKRMFPDEASSLEDTLGERIPPRSFSELVKEKVPLFFICAASAIITMKAQGVGRPQQWPYSFWIRAGNAIVAYARYLGKAVWPSDLAIMYLHPGRNLKLWQVVLSALLLVAITGLVLAYRRYRYLPVGWFWFLGVMVPTIGLMQVGRQAMADRYAYDAFIGLFILVCWGVTDWTRQKHVPNAALATACVVVLLTFSAVTYRQIGYWSDNLKLWQHTLEVTGNNWVANDMVAGILLGQGNREEAMVHYREALVLNPSDAAANLAIALQEQAAGNNQQAIQLYQRALADMPEPLEQSKAYQNMGLAYRSMGEAGEAAECFRKAAKLRDSANK
jgi:protein O-mannosyl-transferase